MVRHHENKKKKVRFTEKKQRLLEAGNDLDRFAGSSDEEEEEEEEIKENANAVNSSKTGEKRKMIDNAKIESQNEKLAHKTKKAVKEGSSEEDNDTNEDDDDDDDDNVNETENSDEVTSDSDKSNKSDLNSESEEEEEPITKDIGMANVMSKILYNHSNLKDKSSTATKVTKTKNGATPILSKTTTPLQKKLIKTKKEESRLKLRRKQLRKDHLSCMHIPQISDLDVIEKERQHRRVATRGVVALFNAIAKHQQKITTASNAIGDSGKKEEDKAPSIDTKRKFLDMLKQTALEGSTTTTNGKAESGIAISQKYGDQNDTEENNQSFKNRGKGWKALQDDYLTGSTLKDWDKEISEDESDRGEGTIEMDDDDF